jgi:hypothetical protein
MSISSGVRLDGAAPIEVLKPLRAVNDALIDLLDSLDADEWRRPTVHRDLSVRHLATHLLHGSIRRVTSIRANGANASAGLPTLTDHADGIIKEDRAFFSAMSQVNPRVLCDLMNRYDPELVDLFEAQRQTPDWFAVACEYIEKWHHQQQLRDATGRHALYDPALLVPALETFARGLPSAYGSVQAPDGTAISICVEPPADIAWTLRRIDGTWSLWSGPERSAQTSIVVNPDLLWRVWTKELPPAGARQTAQICGNWIFAAPFFNFVATST